MERDVLDISAAEALELDVVSYFHITETMMFHVEYCSNVLS